MSEEPKPAAPTNGELIPAPPRSDRPSVIVDPTQARSVYWSSLDMTNLEDKRLLMKAVGRSTHEIEKLAGAPFTTRHVFVHQVEIENEATGELVQTARTVLISPNGETLAFCSAGILRWIGWVADVWGRPPWSPPLGLAVRQVRTRKGFRTYEIDVVETVAAEPAPAGKGGKRG